MFVSSFLSHDYGHMPLLIVKKFLINVLGSKVECRICKGFLISLPLEQPVGLCRCYVPQVISTVHRTTSLLLFTYKSES